MSILDEKTEKSDVRRNADAATSVGAHERYHGVCSSTCRKDGNGSHCKEIVEHRISSTKNRVSQMRGFDRWRSVM